MKMETLTKARKRSSFRKHRFSPHIKINIQYYQNELILDWFPKILDIHMILVDFSNTFLATVLAYHGFNGENEITEDICRHLALNSFLSVN